MATNLRTSLHFFLFLFVLLQLCLVGISSIFRATLTFMEKQFQISSKISGFIVTSNDIPSLLLIIPTTYFGVRLHRPFCIAVGGVVVAVAWAAVVAPHFFLPSISIPFNSTNSSVDSSLLCIHPNSSFNASLYPISTASTFPDDSSESSANRLWALPLVGEILVGMGGTHIYSYGASYIDDFAEKAKSPLYFGILMSANLLGPAFGHLAGAWTSTVYVDADRGATPPVAPDDARWVGAWWLGPLVVSGVILIVAVVFFVFPESLDETGDRRGRASRAAFTKLEESRSSFSVNDVGDTKGKLIQLPFWDFVRAFPRVACRLLTNPVFTLCCFCFGVMMAMVSCLAVFQPKYMQEEFGVSSAKANVLIGSIKLPLGIVGTLGGGAIVGRLRLNNVGISRMLICVSLLITAFITFNLFIGCDTRKVSGVTITANQSCVANCGCDGVLPTPVCGDDGVEYRSPCHAGCEIRIADDNETSDGEPKAYGACACLRLETLIPASNATDPGSAGAGAVAGLCNDPGCATKVYVFIVVGASAALVSGLLQAPTIMLLLRSVSPEDKAFAIGILIVFGRLLGWVPMPPLMGAIIDSTCLSWGGAAGETGATSEADAGSEAGACALYDAPALRHRYWGTLLAFVVVMVAIYVAIGVVVYRKGDEGGKWRDSVGESEREREKEKEREQKRRGAKEKSNKEGESNDLVFTDPTE